VTPGDHPASPRGPRAAARCTDTPRWPASPPPACVTGRSQADPYSCRNMRITRDHTQKALLLSQRCRLRLGCTSTSTSSAREPVEGPERVMFIQQVNHECQLHVVVLARQVGPVQIQKRVQELNLQQRNERFSLSLVFDCLPWSERHVPRRLFARRGRGRTDAATDTQLG
jgi:hypothetical protein